MPGVPTGHQHIRLILIGSVEYRFGRAAGTANDLRPDFDTRRTKALLGISDTLVRGAHHWCLQGPTATTAFPFTAVQTGAGLARTTRPSQPPR